MNAMKNEPTPKYLNMKKCAKCAPALPIQLR